MAYTCSSCGTTYASGWKCTNCEQNQLLKRSMEQQNDLMEKNSRAAAYEARMNREMQEEQAEEARLQTIIKQLEREKEEILKNRFAEIVLLIQTNTVETIGEKFEAFCKQENEKLSAKYLSESGGIFTPEYAKSYRRHFSDYILNNPAKAAEIAVVKQIFESHAKTAKEVWDANEAREAENRRIKEEQEKAEQAIKDEEVAATEVVDLEKKKKARYGCIFFVLMSAALSYIQFADGNFGKGLLCMIGVVFFGFGAWALGPNVTQEDIDSVASGFAKGLNR